MEENGLHYSTKLRTETLIEREALKSAARESVFWRREAEVAGWMVEALMDRLQMGVAARRELINKLRVEFERRAA
jgi:hypothetical protein